MDLRTDGRGRRRLQPPLTAPAGGTVNYTYFDIFRRAAALSILSRVVITRQTGGVNITPGTWNFYYGTGPNEDTTKVLCPCGTLTYRFLGTGLTGDFSAWSAGALAEQTVEQNYTVLERRTFTWQPSTAISPDAIPGQSGVWSDPAVYAALPASQVVTRGGQTATTTFEYRTTDFNDYGQAWKIYQSGDFNQRIDRTFNHTFGAYIVGRVTKEEAWIGSAGITRFERTYDWATGFLTSAFDAEPQGRTFEPTATGNVGAVVDGLGNRTTYSYDWGVVKQVTTQQGVVTTHDVQPNGTIASTTASGAGPPPLSLTTTFQYDLGFRVLSVQPPGSPPPSPTTYEYDNQWGSGSARPAGPRSARRGWTGSAGRG